MHHMRILSKRCKTRPVFKNYEEFEKWQDSFYEDIKEDLRKQELARARSVAMAVGLNPDMVKV